MQTKDRPPLAGLFQIYIASMLPRGAIHYRKAKADSIDSPGTYKRLKERFSNGGRHSAATVNHPNMNKPLVLSKRDLDPSRSEPEPRCLAGVKQ
jgi:hypothetical protein